MRMRTNGFMPGGGIDEGMIICSPFSYVQRLAETVKQLEPPTRKEGMVWLTRVVCVNSLHANGPEETGGITRAAAIEAAPNGLIGHRAMRMKRKSSTAE